MCRNNIVRGALCFTVASLIFSATHNHCSCAISFRIPYIFHLLISFQEILKTSCEWKANSLWCLVENTVLLQLTQSPPAYFLNHFSPEQLWYMEHFCSTNITRLKVILSNNHIFACFAQNLHVILFKS